jgi:hypothetical protein
MATNYSFYHHLSFCVQNVLPFVGSDAKITLSLNPNFKELMLILQLIHLKDFHGGLITTIISFPSGTGNTFMTDVLPKGPNLPDNNVK